MSRVVVGPMSQPLFTISTLVSATGYFIHSVDRLSRSVFETTEKAPLDKTVRIILIVWCLLLPLWAIVASISGMAFDSGSTISAYVVFIWFVFAYPILLGLAFLCRRRKPWLVWLPSLAFVVPVADILVEELVLPLLR